MINTTPQEQAIAKRILRTLQSSSFYDWYQNEFQEYIEGITNETHDKKILEEIHYLFRTEELVALSKKFSDA